MANQRLVNRIRAGLMRRIPLERIRIDMIGSGWSNKDVNEAMRAATQRRPPPGVGRVPNVPRGRVAPESKKTKIKLRTLLIFFFLITVVVVAGFLLFGGSHLESLLQRVKATCSFGP